MKSFIKIKNYFCLITKKRKKSKFWLSSKELSSEVTLHSKNKICILFMFYETLFLSIFWNSVIKFSL